MSLSFTGQARTSGALMPSMLALRSAGGQRPLYCLLNVGPSPAPTRPVSGFTVAWLWDSQIGPGAYRPGLIVSEQDSMTLK